MIKEIFRPTKGKIILALILYIILFLLFIDTTMEVQCIGPPCKSQQPNIVEIALNIVPVLFLWGIAGLVTPGTLPFPIDFILAIVAYFVMPALWAYFWSCVIFLLYNRIRKKAQA